MKKVYLIGVSLIILLLLFCEAFELNEDKKTQEEIKRLQNIVSLKQETNREYAYLMEKTKGKNIDEMISQMKLKTESQKENINNLQNTINTLQDENQTVQNQIDIKYQEIEERKQREQEKLNGTTYKLDQEITYYQFPNYPTGCETISLYILLKYNGVEADIEEIINRMKKGSLPYAIEDKMYGADPEKEFVGDPRNDYSYGVYNNPIAEVAETFKPGVQNIEGLELDEVLDIVSQGRPVMVWTTIGNIPSRISEMWLDRITGEKIYWKENEHAVVIIGYNDSQVIVSDPYNGRITRYNRETFRQNYNYMGKKAVYY